MAAPQITWMSACRGSAFANRYGIRSLAFPLASSAHEASPWASRLAPSTARKPRSEAVTRAPGGA